MQAGAMDVVHVLSLLLIEGSRRSECQDLGKPDNRVQRCPQLVAHVGQEVALGAAGGLGLLLCLPKFVFTAPALGHVEPHSDGSAVSGPDRKSTRLNSSH